MADELYGFLADLCRPQDRTSIVEWSERWVKPPNSARSKTGFDPLQSPHLIEPINAHQDASLREIVCLMPTGAGKTTIFDCTIPYEIVEDPDGILLAIQGNNDAKQHVQARLMPILKKIPQIASLMAGMNRHNIKRDCVIFPHMDLWMGGVNMTNAQRKSVRRVKIDEAWEAQPHGIIEEFRARTHDRPLSLVTIVSQGGVCTINTDDGPVKTELEDAWSRTDQRVFHFKCPECGDVQRFRLKALRYEKNEKDDGTIDEKAIRESARYVCLGRCETEFQDTPENRYALANNGLYIPINPEASPELRGYQCNVLGLHYVPWKKTALQFAQAHVARKNGDDTKIRIFRQKRMAENYREEEDAPQAPLTFGDYRLADYASGELWEGESFRNAGIDRQRDHFWLVIRAWKMDGTSRRLYAGRINTHAALVEKLTEMKVAPENIFEDSNYEPNEVYNDSGRYRWWAIAGGEESNFAFSRQNGVRKFYSPVIPVRGNCGLPGRLVRFSELNVKRILDKMQGGYRERFEFESDISPLHVRHLFSEVEKDEINKKTGKITRKMVKRHKDNHTRDCEAYCLVGALIRGALADRPDQKDSAPEQKAEPVVNNDN